MVVMTSSEVAYVARRRSGGVPSDINAHADMFVWSKGHVTVRDLVVGRLVGIPTIVRISSSEYTTESLPYKNNFDQETVCMIN